MINREVRYKAIVHYKYFLRSLRAVSKLYGVSKSSLQRWVHSDPAAKAPRRTSRRSITLELIKDTLATAIKADPFISMERLAQYISAHCAVKRCRSTIGTYRRFCGYTLKKAFRTVKACHDADAVRQFCTEHVLTGPNLICLDEACFHVGDVPRRGYSLRGQRLDVPHPNRLRRNKLLH